MIKGKLEIRWTENPPVTARTISVTKHEVTIKDAEFLLALIEKVMHW